MGGGALSGRAVSGEVVSGRAVWGGGVEGWETLNKFFSLQVVGSWVFTRASGQVSHSSRIYNPESDGIYVNNFYFVSTLPNTLPTC